MTGQENWLQIGFVFDWNRGTNCDKYHPLHESSVAFKAASQERRLCEGWFATPPPPLQASTTFVYEAVVHIFNDGYLLSQITDFHNACCCRKWWHQTFSDR